MTASTGKMSAVGLVMWLKKITRVWGVIPSHKQLTNASVDFTGTGMGWFM